MNTSLNLKNKINCGFACDMRREAQRMISCNDAWSRYTTIA